MALVGCTECGAKISPNAVTCPKCGDPDPHRKASTPCVMCGSSTPTQHSGPCPECGEPDPFGNLEVAAVKPIKMNIREPEPFGNLAIASGRPTNVNIKRASFSLLLVLFIVGLVSSAAGFAAYVNYQETMGWESYNPDERLWKLFIFCSFVSAIAFIFLTIFSAMYTHIMWKLIEGMGARTTPAKAVGFLFIPLFNIYWVYQALWGWSVDFNKLVDRRVIDGPLMPTGLFLAICIMISISVIPFINILVALPLMVLSLIAWAKICKAINTASVTSLGHDLRYKFQGAQEGKLARSA